VVLGIAQDAGFHSSVAIRNCADRFAKEAQARACLQSRARESQTRLSYLFDATPGHGLAARHRSMAGHAPTTIFLTHGHIGHYTGLMYLGRESMDAKSVPVYGTARMTSFLSANAPWSLLVSRKNIDPPRHEPQRTDPVS
jgi:pyrroloquinoline quinone biosynthesis protein B